ncbi:DUF3313 family protein [Prosthecobacter sp.]|uniref:DUF3313 family protein n=1 Tax=Prosthecobacter sp. TaxID=1965333 RepID=UPI0025EF30F1|nr:DUF3313 family protein [Prosthecobacter sp.]
MASPSMRFPHSIFALLLVLPACSSTNRMLKAKPVALSPFFQQPWLAQDASAQLGFQKIWTTPDPKLLAEGKAKRKLYIAPVTLNYLRPLNRTFSSGEVAWGGVQRREADVAMRLREDFVEAFRRSPAPLYHLVNQPGKDTLTLQLAIIELNPTSPKGNMVVTVLKFVVTPVIGLAAYFTKGNMAIEGRVVDSTSGRVFFQFADNEADKLTFINLRDYQPYGHAMNTMRHWAMQFEQMTRSPRGWKVRDSGSITLRPN